MRATNIRHEDFTADIVTLMLPMRTMMRHYDAVALYVADALLLMLRYNGALLLRHYIR